MVKVNHTENSYYFQKITTPQKVAAEATTTIHSSNKFVDLILAECAFLCLAIKKK